MKHQKFHLMDHATFARHRPDVLHVFTNGPPDAPAERASGLFVYRGDYLSALRNTSNIEHYSEVCLPINTKPGVVAFETEAALTQTFYPKFPLHQDNHPRRLRESMNG